MVIVNAATTSASVITLTTIAVLIMASEHGHVLHVIIITSIVSVEEEAGVVLAQVLVTITIGTEIVLHAAIM